MIETLAFYIFGGISLASAVGVVVSKNIVRTALCLLGTLGGVACLYFLMHANLLAVIQLIVYAGGTLVLIIFGVMLTSKSPWVGYQPTRRQAIGATFVALVLAVGISTVVLSADWTQSAAGAMQESPKVADVGNMLLTKYLVPFEVASVLLLVVMIGAAYLARPEE